MKGPSPPSLFFQSVPLELYPLWRFSASLAWTSERYCGESSPVLDMGVMGICGLVVGRGRTKMQHGGKGSATLDILGGRWNKGKTSFVFNLVVGASSL